MRKHPEKLASTNHLQGSEQRGWKQWKQWKQWKLREESKTLEGRCGSRQEITSCNSSHFPQLTKRWEKREEPFKRR